MGRATRAGRSSRRRYSRRRLLQAEILQCFPDHLVGEAPLVVVPTHHLRQVAADHAGHVELDHRRPRIPYDVAGDKRILGDAKDFPVTLGRGLLSQSGVYLFSGSLPTEQEHEVRDRTDRDWAAHRDAVEAPSHLRERLGRGDRCSGAGRNEVRGGSPPAAEVFLAAGAVHDRLGGRVGVDRGEERLLDTEVAGRKIYPPGGVVCGATRTREDGRAAARTVHAVDDRRDIRAARRSGENNPRRTSLYVLAGVFLLREQARAFENKLHAQIAPRQPGGIAFTEVADGLPVHEQSSVHRFHVPFVTSVDSIVLDEVRHVLERVDVVHCDQLQFWGVQNQLQRLSSDTAETVDRYLRRHLFLL